MPAGEALSPLDAAFLHLESPRTPMHMGLVGLFEGGPLLDRHGRVKVRAMREMIDRRLDLVPKLRRRVQPALLGEAPPVWLDDREFAVAHHVRRSTLPAPGSEAELAELCATILAQPLDRSRPLWELWLVDGLADGRVAIVEKVHHAMADGLAGIALATVLLDVTAHPPRRRARQDGPEHPWRPAVPPAAAASVLRDVARLLAVPASGALLALDTLRHPVVRARRATAVAGALGTLVSVRTIAPRSSLNRPVGSHRHVAFVRESFEDVQRVGHRYGATANDVLLAAVAGGLRRLLLGREEPVAGRTLQALVPVGLAAGSLDRLGNQVSALLVRLPIGVEDPIDRLLAVAAEVGNRKAHRQKTAGQFLLGLLDPLPQHAIAGLALLVDHQPFVNLVVTDVPGPPVPLFTVGSRMLEAFPVVPLAGNLDIGVAALSYDGQLNVGILTDPVACPDAAVFAEGLHETFAEMIADTGPARDTADVTGDPGG
jgi:WS/DGAT/MGAT family acyltransferase